MGLFFEISETIPKGNGFSHYSGVHLMWLGIFLALTVACCFVYRRLDEKGKRIMGYVIAALIVLDEVYKHTFLIIGGHYGEYWMKYIPLHLCSVNIVLIAIHSVKPFKVLDDYLYTVGIPAAVMALVFPSWTRLPLGNFMHIHSFSVHILLALYPIMLTVGGKIRPNWRNAWKSVVMLVVLAIPALIANLVFDTNYMFLCSASKGNPLYLFKELFGSHLYGFPILILAVLVVMLLPWAIGEIFAKRKAKRS